jgi:hypothetical protein
LHLSAAAADEGARLQTVVSEGLRTANPGRFKTCVQIIVVVTGQLLHR